MIKGIVKPKYSDYNVNNNLIIIKSNWRKICFPNTKQKLKTINKSEIGKFLKQERLFQGWSLKFVAELINISEVTLKSYEDGNRLFRLDVIYKLTQIYDMSIDELIKNK